MTIVAAASVALRELAADNRNFATGLIVGGSQAKSELKDPFQHGEMGG